MREIVLDTETTGLDPAAGHRIIEIGAIELWNHVPTSRTYHQYINPQMEVHEDAIAVHGITNAQLENCPTFPEIVGDFMAFVDESVMVIHNAEFDMKFINHHVAELGFPAFPAHRSLCTLKLTRRRFPGAPASLDALCQRFRVDNAGRTLHGGLLDAQLLAEVYMELLGGRQSTLGLMEVESVVASALAEMDVVIRPGRTHQASPEEIAAHAAMLAALKNPLWLVETAEA